MDNNKIICPSCKRSFSKEKVAHTSPRCPECGESLHPLEGETNLDSRVIEAKDTRISDRLPRPAHSDSQGQTQIEDSLATPQVSPHQSDFYEKSDTRATNQSPSSSPRREGLFVPGQLLEGKIEIKRLLGQGGMGAVYLGYDRKLRRQVAIKVLSPNLLASEDMKARFAREAQTAATLNHPHIVQVYGFGEEGDLPYISMEYVEGKSLREIIDERETLSLSRAIQMALQVTRALEAAHGEGILHRDLKPDNIFVTKDNLAKLGDFGLAKAADASTLTQTGSILGTPYYMSPEQAEGKEVDSTTDIYALGATLFNLLIGHPPFQGNTPASILYKQVNEPLIFPREVRFELPLEVKKIIKKTMAKEKWRRYQKASELKKALEKIKDKIDRGKLSTGSPVSSPRPPVSSDSTTSPTGAKSPSPSTVSLPSQKEKKGIGVAVGVALCTLLLAVSGWVAGEIFFAPSANDKEGRKAQGEISPEKKGEKSDKTSGKDLTSTGSQSEDHRAPIEVYKEVKRLREAKKYEEALKILKKNTKLYPRDDWLAEKYDFVKNKVETDRFLKKLKLGKLKKDRNRPPRNEEKGGGKEVDGRNLKEALASADPGRRMEALKNFLDQKPRGTNALDLVMEVIEKEKTPRIRALAARHLGLIWQRTKGASTLYLKKVTDALRLVIRDNHRPHLTRPAAFESLRVMDTSAAPTLVILLNNPNHDICTRAKKVLIELGAGVALYVTQAFTFRPHAQKMAREILVQMGKGARKSEVRNAVIQAMNRKSDARVRQNGKKVLDDLKRSK